MVVDSRGALEADPKDRGGESCGQGFMEYQQQAEEILGEKQEEQRWKRECEMEEKRRKEERGHELRLFTMLRQMLGPHTSTYLGHTCTHCRNQIHQVVHTKVTHTYRTSYNYPPGMK